MLYQRTPSDSGIAPAHSIRPIPLL